MTKKHLHSPPSLSIMPRHVAIIMDGNGRWAKQKGRLRSFGHKNGLKAVENAIAYATKSGINVLTLYAFSSENWRRPAKEVSTLMSLFMRVLERQTYWLEKHNIKLNIIGDRQRFGGKLQEKIQQTEKRTENNTGLVLNIAANYGGRWDILQAVKKLINAPILGEDFSKNLTEETFETLLVTGKQPPVDLVIRTGGEQRISNFLLWQVAYAELYFCNVLWPDFTEDDFHHAIINFQQRERRFGASS